MTIRRAKAPSEREPARPMHIADVMPRFDDRYRESVVLLDGSRVTLRLVRPDDKALLRRGFERLAPESRYRRFLAAKSRLTDGELAYLTEVDGHDHFAMGAVAEDANGDEEGVAIARFVRSKSDPRVAEVAVAVVDDWQRKGLGTLLLLRLVAAARERAIDRFAGQALADNAAVRDALAQLPQGVRVQPEGNELAFEVQLPDVSPEAPPQPQAAHVPPIRRLLALMAKGWVLVREALGRAHPQSGGQPNPTAEPDTAQDREASAH